MSIALIQIKGGRSVAGGMCIQKFVCARGPFYNLFICDCCCFSQRTLNFAFARLNGLILSARKGGCLEKAARVAIPHVIHLVPGLAGFVNALFCV